MKRINSKGFTLVEIIIVLAIASLVIGLVLIAAAGAQSNARDTQRRSDATILAKAIEQWASNNNGTLPTGTQLTDTTGTGSLVGGAYLDVTKFRDPSTSSVYMIVASPAPSSCTGTGTMYADIVSSTSYTVSTCLENKVVYTYTP